MPRSKTFDVDAALEKAVDLFARQGYESTSIAELTQAMGLTPPQLYRAFGDKRHLFELVLERYGEHRQPYLDEVVSQPTVQLAAERFLVGAAEHDTAAGQPRGCLTVQGCLNDGPDTHEIAQMLSLTRSRNQLTLQRRLERGVEDGDLAPDTDTEALARYLSTVAQGISVQASGGASQEELLKVARVALTAVPQLADPAGIA